MTNKNFELESVLIQENKMMDLTVELWNPSKELDQTHPSDISDMCDTIHDIQKIIAIRIVRRDENSRFIIKK